MPEPYIVKVPGPGNVEREVQVYLPSEQAHMQVSQDGVERYRLSDAAWAQNVGVAVLVRKWSAEAGFADDVARSALGVGLHADGLSYSTTQRVGYNRSAVVSAWNFITPDEDAARGKRFFFYGLSKKLLCNCGCEGYHTIDALNWVFAWSMVTCMLGVFPTRRHDGSAFTAHDRRNRKRGRMSCRAALLQVRGDWEWLTQAFRLRHYGADFFCWMCRASQAGPHSYLDTSPDAPWRSTIMSHEQYIEQMAQLAQAPSKLFLAPFFRYEYFCVDSMHAIDLGVFPDFAGSLFYLEIASKTLHNNYAAGLAFLNAELQAYYSCNKGLSAIELTLPAVKPSDGGAPSLKAKAAACRHLGPFLVYLAQRHARVGFQLEDDRLAQYSAEYRELVVKCAEFFVAYHSSCETVPFSPEYCKASMLGFLAAYNQLRQLFRRGVPPEEHSSQPFGARPKFHIADHLVSEKIFLYGSPRQFWCYGDEDFIGLIKRICVQTRHPRTMEARIVAKYALYCALHAYALHQMQ